MYKRRYVTICVRYLVGFVTVTGGANKRFLKILGVAFSTLSEMEAQHDSEEVATTIVLQPSKKALKILAFRLRALSVVDLYCQVNPSPGPRPPFLVARSLGAFVK